jgi:hypothetical protein
MFKKEIMEFLLNKYWKKDGGGIFNKKILLKLIYSGPNGLKKILLTKCNVLVFKIWKLVLMNMLKMSLIHNKR